MDATVFHVGILHVGIDVSKDRLDGHAHETGERLSVANDTEGIPALATWAHAMAPRLIGFEAIGAYEALPAASPAQAGLPVVVVNPTQVRRFTQALGERAKTDVIDAAVIAYFLVATQPEVRPLKDEDARLLSDLVARRGQIVAMITAERQRECTAPPRVKKSIARLLKALMRALESFHGDLDNAIKASPSWRKNEDLLASVPDVVRIIARTRIADAPELDRLDRRQIAALAGLAPWTRQSGQWRRKGFIGGGRVDVRCALYAVRFTLCALHGRFTWALYMGALHGRIGRCAVQSRPQGLPREARRRRRAENGRPRRRRPQTPHHPQRNP
jgi:transposase